MIRLAGIALSAVAVLWALSGFEPLLAPLIAPAAEIRIGASLLDEIRPQLVTDRGTEARALARLAQRLAAHTDLVLLPRVEILHDEQVTAYALPGSILLVTDSLVDRAASENELAFVLGHLIGHLVHDEHLESLGRGLLPAALADFLGIGRERVARALLRNGLLGRQRFRGRQEAAADRFGLWLLQQEYGHVGGADEFFRTLREVGWPASHFAETPPTAQARARALHFVIRDEEWTTMRVQPKPWIRSGIPES